MRVQEFTANAGTADLVLEQDFILRLRRWQRHGTPLSMINFQLVNVVGRDADKIEAWHKQISQQALLCQGEMYRLTSGDVFVVLPPKASAVDVLKKQLLEHLHSEPGFKGEEAEKLFVHYDFPAQYTQLRERLNEYMDRQRAAGQVREVKPSAQQMLQSEQAQGSLTAWSLSQIESLLTDLDVARYVRAQPIYKRDGTTWKPAATEYYIGIEELKKERFPRLNLRAPERLFLELCSTLDKRLMQEVMPQNIWPQQRVHMNLAMETALTGGFVEFCRAVPRPMRQNVVFELNRSDLLFDFTTTLNVLKILRTEGFVIALDGIHPEILPYFNLQLFDVDFYKIKVSRDHFEPLTQPTVVQALRKIPSEKIIFYRCEQEAALAIGQQLGISLYQGWLIDDIALA